MNDAPNYYDHPVFCPHHLQLETPAMQGLLDDIHRWLWTGVTGAIVLGEARVGKTTAINWLAPRIRTRSGVSAPVFYVSIPRRDVSTITSVFRQLCWCSDLAVSNHDKADLLADRFTYYITDAVAAAQVRQAVLLVDEMQRLHARQFDAFAELYDKLRTLDIQLLVVFIGNDQESSPLVEQVKSGHYAHIYGRFFTQYHRFRGLLSETDVHKCLTQYDHLCFPNDGPTYTQHFLPDAFSQGWRLASLSTLVWHCFHEEQRRLGLSSWGMQYFITAVNVLLSDYLPEYGIEACGEPIIQDCIALSGLATAPVGQSP